MNEKRLILREFLPYQLATTSAAVSNLIARSYRARFGLKIPEWRVMAVMGEMRSATQRELAEATGMDKVTINRACKALVDRGLLGRAPNQADGRSHHLALSEEGRALYNEIVPEALAVEDRLELALGADNTQRLSEILEELRVLVSGINR